MIVKPSAKKIAIFIGVAFVVGSIAQFVVSETYFSNSRAEAAMLYVKMNQGVAEVFGTPLKVEVVRRRGYGNPIAEFKREHEYTVLVDGSKSDGFVRVVETRSGLSPAFRIAGIDAATE